jgi:hypothetical protein
MSAPTHYAIRDWRKYQHYSQRNPPWIKLHYELLSSPEWVVLADASKALAVACMLIASRDEGRVPNNPEYMKRVCYLKACDFNPLVECGLLIQLADASDCKQMLAVACPSVSVSVRTKKENSALSADASRLASLLSELMRRNNPKATVPANLTGWAKEIALLNSKNGYEWSEIERVLRWSQDSAFWWPNILSGAKLRKQYDTLHGQSIAKAAPPKPREPVDPGPEFWAQDCLRIQQEEEQKRAEREARNAGR